VEREELHDALSSYAKHVAPVLTHGVLTRWVTVMEFAMPDGDLALHRLSGQADGRPLVAWDVDSLLFHSLMRHRQPGTPYFPREDPPS
jgi:hypothetical protein